MVDFVDSTDRIHVQIACIRAHLVCFLLMCLLIAPTIGVIAAADDTLRINGKIAFATNRNGNLEIYVMNADGSGQTRLTNNNAADENPDWAPDGTKIAFDSVRDGNKEIYVMNADGSGQTRLTNNNYYDEQPSWSPDGTKIAFPSERDGNLEIYVMNADGSGQTRLTNNNAADEQPRWSPDGTKIAFNTNRDGNMEIYVMNTDGSGQTRLTNNNAGDEDPDWSPDGTKIVFVSNRDGNYKIYVMNADGSEQTRLTNNAQDWDPRWSPDGTKIAFDSDRVGNWNCYTMNPDGSGQTRLTDNNAIDWSPSWQSVYLTKFKQDGPRMNGKIAFQSDRDGNYEIYVMNPDGSGQTRLTNNNYKEEHPSWSPDGSKIAFMSLRDGNAEIYVMNADGSGQTRLTYNSANDCRPSWSSDGTKIAFDSDRDGNWNIYTMNADGSGQTRLTDNNAVDWGPFWQSMHSNGKIVFKSNRDGNWEIYVMNVDGSGQTRLTNNNYGDEYPSWSPDGTRIIFISNRDGNEEIYVMNADGSGQTRLTNNNFNDEVPSWSPDGAKIAFASNRDGESNIYIMKSDGSGEMKLTNNIVGLEGDWWPAWQSLSKQTATLTLQSSTTNTMVNMFFNLNATLSAPKSGVVTLCWSINGSGFVNRQNGTMTNGRYSRVFGAGSPGTWVFTVVWAGDDEYKGAESNNVTVTIQIPPPIVVATSASPDMVYSGGTSTIRASLTSGGKPVTGAAVNLASSNGGVFSTVIDKGNGTYIVTFTAPDIVTQSMCTITASAQRSGYQDGSGQTQVAIKPLVINIYVKSSDGAPIADVAFASTSQPSGQTVLSGTTDGNGQASFGNVQKGAYSFKVMKSGYDDKTWTLTVQQGQAYSETITLVKQSGGVPGYPALSVALALLTATIVLYLGKRRGARLTSIC